MHPSLERLQILRAGKNGGMERVSVPGSHENKSNAEWDMNIKNISGTKMIKSRIVMF